MDDAAGFRFQLAEGRDVPGNEVGHVDVVAHARAVRGVVVVAEHLEFLADARRRLADVGHEVVRDAVGVLADEPGFVCAHRVEVAQDGYVELGMREGHVADGFLDVQLGAPVRVDRAQGMFFGERQEMRHAVDRGGRAEHQRAAVFEAHFKDGQRGIVVVPVVHERMGHGFAHGLVSREVDDRVDRVFREQLFHDGDVAGVRLDEGDFPAADGLHGVENRRAAVVEVVQTQGIVPLFHEFHEHVGAQIAGSAGDENLAHNVFS